MITENTDQPVEVNRLRLIADSRHDLFEFLRGLPLEISVSYRYARDQKTYITLWGFTSSGIAIPLEQLAQMAGVEGRVMAKQLLRLLEPDLCQTCRFNNGSKVVTSKDGQTLEAQVVCTRGDCDNWDHSTIESIEESDGA